MKKSYVTRKEFMAAFNKVSGVAARVQARKTTAFKKRVEKIFPSTKPQSKMEAGALNKALMKAVRNGSRFIDLNNGEQGFHMHLAMHVILSMPKLYKAQYGTAMPKKGRFNGRARKETLKEKVARLERENADLRSQGSHSAPLTPQDPWRDPNPAWGDDGRISGISPEPRRHGFRD